MTTIQRKLWTIRDICEYTGKSQGTVYEYIRAGIIPKSCKAKIPFRWIPEAVIKSLEDWKKANN